MMKLNIVPPVIAHRGACSYAPENTFAAFLKAKELGATWVEFDVMLTSDHQAVVIHDETLDRTTNGKGKVSDHTLSYIQSLDAGSWFNPKFANERIPTFRDTIDYLHSLGLSANVEIKAQPGMEKQTAKVVLDLIAEHWPKDMPPPLVSSFSRDILRVVREYSSTCLLGFLMDEWMDDWQSFCDELQCAAVDVNYKILTPDNVKLIKDTGRTLLSYTVDDPQLALKLYPWGVDGVFSNYPDRIMAALSK